VLRTRKPKLGGGWVGVDLGERVDVGVSMAMSNSRECADVGAGMSM